MMELSNIHLIIIILFAFCFGATSMARLCAYLITKKRKEEEVTNEI